jgi:hypothetical protein
VHIRVAIVVGALGAVLVGGCTGSSTSGKPTVGPPINTSPTALASSGHLSEYCSKLVAAAAKINSAQAALYGGGSGSAHAVQELVAQLQALKAGAPAQIGGALDDMITGYQTAQSLLANPTSANKAQLVALAPKLSADAQQIDTYAVSSCPSH